MATYYSDRVNANGTHNIRAGFGLVTDICTVSVGTALVNSDLIKLFTIPSGARVTNIQVAGYGVQSGTDAVYTIGDVTVTNRLVTVANGLNLRSNNASQAAGIFSIPSATLGIGYKYTANTDINMTITTAGTGMTTGGTIIVLIQYFME